MESNSTAGEAAAFRNNIGDTANLEIPIRALYRPSSPSSSTCLSQLLKPSSCFILKSLNHSSADRASNFQPFQNAPQIQIASLLFCSGSLHNCDPSFVSLLVPHLPTQDHPTLQQYLSRPYLSISSHARDLAFQSHEKTRFLRGVYPEQYRGCRNDNWNTGTKNEGGSTARQFEHVYYFVFICSSRCASRSSASPATSFGNTSRVTFSSLTA